MKRIHIFNPMNKGSSSLQATGTKTLVPTMMWTPMTRWASSVGTRLAKLPNRKKNRHGTTKNGNFFRRNRTNGVSSSPPSL